MPPPCHTSSFSNLVVASLVEGERELLLRWVEGLRAQGALDAPTTQHLFSRAAALDLESLTPVGYSTVEYSTLTLTLPPTHQP